MAIISWLLPGFILLKARACETPGPLVREVEASAWDFSTCSSLRGALHRCRLQSVSQVGPRCVSNKLLEDADLLGPALGVVGFGSQTSAWPRILWGAVKTPQFLIWDAWCGGRGLALLTSSQGCCCCWWGGQTLRSTALGSAWSVWPWGCRGGCSEGPQTPRRHQGNQVFPGIFSRLSL